MNQSVMKTSRKTRMCGFTLWEMLVVFAVVVVLTALLIPALRLARAKNCHMSCTSNLKQLNLAMNLYSDDVEAAGGESRFPATIGELVCKPDGSPSSYMIDPRMLICRSDRSGRIVATNGRLTAANCSYALNAEANPTNLHGQLVVLCDKNGAGRLKAGDVNGFGGNHGGDGGAVMLASGAGLFYTPVEWSSNTQSFVEIGQ